MRTICVYHRIDLDGWMSAAIVKYWWEKNNPNGVFYNNPYEGDCSIIAGKENENSLSMLGFHYGDDIPNLNAYDKVIMCDISFPKEEMRNLSFNKDKKLIWIDHHISAINEIQNEQHNITLFDGTDYIFDDLKLEPKEARINGFRNTKFSSCELTWFYYFGNAPMPEIVRLLGRYDCFGHKGTDEEKKVLEFQYGARAVITDYKSAYDLLCLSIGEKTIGVEQTIRSSGVFIYRYLCVEAKQIYKTGFEIELIEPLYYNDSEVNKGESVIRKFLCFNKERFNPINFDIDYHSNGYAGIATFHYENGFWSFSLYNDNGKVDCSKIANQYGGGGHKGASGFRIKNIEDFLKKVS